jgi:predicted DNA binding CopG/RHH family protein
MEKGQFRIMPTEKITITLPEELIEKLRKKKDLEGVPISVQIKKLLEKEVHK